MIDAACEGCAPKAVRKLVRSHCGEVQVLNPMQGTHVRRAACGQVRNSKNEFAIEDSEVEPDTKTAVVQNRTVSAHAQGQSRCEALQILLSVPIPDITQVPAHGVRYPSPLGYRPPDARIS